MPPLQSELGTVHAGTEEDLPLTCDYYTDTGYPVILSIENHCSVTQQKKMAQYLTEILGDKLDLSSVVNEDLAKLPSPESLKGKILVKVMDNFLLFMIGSPARSLVDVLAPGLLSDS
ncbi:UNVERIFIED_CONTAM: hypothetical protein K2H54_013084 [Gekko kuhli]